MFAEKKTIKEFFSENRTFEVPFFQRSYVWKEQEWRRFIEDMIYISESRRDASHFWGSIILKQIPTIAGQPAETRWMVIDGQQRLMTLCLFFKALWLLSPLGEDTFLPCLKDVLIPSLKDKEVFEEIMNLERNQAYVATNEENGESDDEENEGTDDVEKNERDPKGRLCEAFHFIYNHLKAELEKVAPEKVINAIVFVRIDLDADENEQQVFDTINTGGMKLTTSELLKNRLFTPDDKDDYEKNWKAVFEKDKKTWDYWEKEIRVGNTKKKMVDLFLYSFLRIKVHTHDLTHTTKISGDDKEAFSKVEGLIDSYKRYIDTYYLKEGNGSKKKLIEEIREYAETFRGFFDTEKFKKNPIHNSKERLNTLIFGLGNTTLVPYVLYVLKTVSKEMERDKIFEYLESFVMRRVITKRSNKGYNNLFGGQLIAHEVSTAKQLKDHVHKLAKTEFAMPNDDELRKGFHNSKLNNGQARGVLYFIESHLKMKKRAYHASKLRGLRQYSVEHLMPKNWNNNKWGKLPPEEADRRDRTLLTLGNLAIIPPGLNKKLKDEAWKKKVKGTKEDGGLEFFASGLITLQRFLKRVKWDESCIRRRADFLWKRAMECWEQ